MIIAKADVPGSSPILVVDNRRADHQSNKLKAKTPFIVSYMDQLIGLAMSVM